MSGCIGGADPAAVPLKELGLIMFLKFPDSQAGRRLCHVQLAGGTGDTFLLVYRVKYTDMFESG